ncbi:MAG: RagB/SusD family nutrient uptake outer membrane protein [Bacteroidetes bacterium]|nr:RagB/SusD family nutrient uptake outer membrane protein [Bacteroidota bacterium]MBS1973933.1 RagB/SusD family nutrient uptake outer membrane protein [Bacteroidota bacterium]
MKNKIMLTGKALALIFGVTILSFSCTRLDTKVYSPVPDANFWQTPEQIAAGVAPAYQALQALPDGNLYEMSETSSGVMITPTRGNDWYDGGDHLSLWLHTWNQDRGFINGLWGDIFNGIGKSNFTLSVVNSLTNKPSNIDAINAELKALRAYFYYLAMDNFGNVPLVTDFNTDPNSVTNSTRATVFAFVEKELKDNMQFLPGNVDKSTYGRMTRWAAHMLLAKLYLNAGVYLGAGNERWADAISECDSVISSGKYSLSGNYFDNFAIDNSGSAENILVVPFDKTYIGGNNWEMQTLHYQSNSTYGLTNSPWNGYCATADIYNEFDNADKRKAMWLVGQQYGADGSALKDLQTGLPLIFTPNVPSTSDPSPAFRLVGARSIKYHPEAGTGGNQSNDMVIFRLADAYLMRAEAEFQLGSPASAAADVNLVRERAYGEAPGGAHDWQIADVTSANLLAERQREMMWECWSRQDAIRFGTFGNARNPGKGADADAHWQIFPIPTPQMTANSKLTQNPGY